MKKFLLKKNGSKLPGFGLTLGFSLAYMSFLVLIPLGALVLYSTRSTPAGFLAIISDDRVSAAFEVSVLSAFYAALVNCFFGLAIAWMLTRYEFYGKKIIDALIDLPFAIPTAVAGISLATVFSANGALGKLLANFNIEIAYSRTSIVIALIFIGFPFIVRTVQPVLEDLDQEVEEAASSLGANFFQIFTRIIFPAIFPALLTGFALAFARGLGEYGSIIFISSNMPYETEIVPLLIVKKLLQFDYVGASVIGVAMLVCAFLLLLSINFLQGYARNRRGT
ncbi:sulfate ABC transporter permease [Betaproteobacteria bacterium]|nr:sulfate ABC transporter permease [Betaproteobacteria bacterium]